MKMKVYLILLAVCCVLLSNAQSKILFDATKAESAGDADWVIDADVHNLSWSNGPAQVGAGNESNPQRYPTPLQSTVTSTTVETYWEGGLSAWGIDLVKLGYEVETLPITDSITYGDANNPQDLSNYKVFIVDEPNILFTTKEKAAMFNFVKNGGGLFMISDHLGADRNNDGYDSPTIWNDFVNTYNNPFGIKWALNNFSQTTTNVPNLPGDSLLHGPYGSPTKMEYSNGTSLIINPTINPSVKGVMYETGCSNTGDTGVMFCYARYGLGKVVGTGDSSPEDDGTGDPNDVLYNGWTSDAGGNHEKLIMNATIWLAETSNASADSFGLGTTNDTTICAGSSLTLTAHGATSYLWKPGNQTTASITVQPSATGLYVVTGTTGGVSQSDTVNVTVDAFPNTTPQITVTGATTFCAGDSVLLTSAAGSSYIWSNNATTRAIEVKANGSYYVTITDNNGCTAQSNIVSINEDKFSQSVPPVTVNGATQICTGGSVTLSGPNGSTYLWNTGATLQTIVVNQSGPYFIVLTDGNGCKTNSDTINVVVGAALSGVKITANGPLTICSGDSVTLSAPAGYQYQWSSNNSSLQSITVNTAGSYYTLLSAGGGCTGVSDTLTVAIDSFNLTAPVISVSGPNTLCQNDSSTTLSTATGGTYLWSNGQTTQSIIVTQPGIIAYTVSVSDANSCRAVSAPVTITVHASPVVSLNISPDSVCLNGAAITLTQGLPAGGTYTGIGVSGTQFNPAAAGTGAHLIGYTYIDTNGCRNAASQLLYVDVCTGIDLVDEHALTIYPNPSTGIFELQASSNIQQGVIAIYNLAGQMAFVTPVDFSAAVKITLNLSTLQAGVYLAVFTDGFNTLRKKLVKVD